MGMLVEVGLFDGVGAVFDESQDAKTEFKVMARQFIVYELTQNRCLKT